jgi:macrolide-specific efflux system membrane fusion protein
MLRIVTTMVLVCGLLGLFGGGIPPAVWAQNGQGPDILVSGKVFCSLKHRVVTTFDCEVMSVRAYPGLAVKQGDVLAHYSLKPESILALKRRVKRTNLNNLEIRLLNLRQRVAQTERKLRQVRQLADENLAAKGTVSEVNTELALLYKEKDLLSSNLAQERELADDDLAILEDKMGQPINENNIPTNGDFTSPADGYVVWMSDQVRPGSELRGGSPVFQVGVMDPMILLAQVHEIEAQKLKVGDHALFKPESMPDKQFECRITKISWAPSETSIEQPTYYQVELELKNPQSLLKEGQKGRVEFLNAGN